MNWDVIEQHIEDVTGTPFKIRLQKSISGGSINDAYMISSGEKNYFVKLNSPHQEDMFAAEAQGLIELGKANAIKVPTVTCWGADTSSSYIVMEFIESGRGNAQSHHQFGKQLAAMHRFTADRFGWFRDNTIGSTPQQNTQTHDWIKFLREQRLGFQLKLAASNGFGGRLQKDGAKLLDNLDVFFADYTPQASLLHGDLWSGNYSFDSDGQPIIFDPAVYYGDREADIAMTELFGGFNTEFYAAYNDDYPLDQGYQSRKNLYNLYHIINHVNLFGSGYLGQAERMISQLLICMP